MSERKESTPKSADQVGEAVAWYDQQDSVNIGLHRSLKRFSMSHRIPFLLGCLAIGALPACSKHQPAPPAATTAVPAQIETSIEVPTCSIESKREINVGEGTELWVWNLKLAGLKQLTARILIATDGKVVPGSVLTYRWEGWKPEQPAATGELVLIIQDGKIFDVKGKACQF